MHRPKKSTALPAESPDKKAHGQANNQGDTTYEKERGLGRINQRIIQHVVGDMIRGQLPAAVIFYQCGGPTVGEIEVATKNTVMRHGLAEGNPGIAAVVENRQLVRGGGDLVPFERLFAH